MGYIPKNSATKDFYSVFDAKSKGIYLLKGQKKENIINYPEEPQVLSIKEAGQLLKGQIIITCHYETLKQHFLDSFCESSFCESSSFNAPHIAQLVHEKYLKKEFLSLYDLPLYYLNETP